MVATVAVVAVGVGLTLSPLASRLGFTPLPLQFFVALALLTVAYLALVEATKKVFYADPMHLAGQPKRVRGRAHRIERRAAKFTRHASRPAAAPRGSVLPQEDSPEMSSTTGPR